MFEKFTTHIQTNFPFLADKKLLLAVSGGLDSMVMTTLFRESGFDISIAHCNFNLRGNESDDDAKFVEEFALSNRIQLYATSFNTAKFAEDNKVSIQVAARQLRYMWFSELLEQYGLDFVLTAHHADDSIETFLINLSRGTGLDGLTGIPQQNGKILRPLLIFSRDEIRQFAIINKIQWREDSSNSSDKYLRNKLRQVVIPELKNINPNLVSVFMQTIENLKQSKSMAEDASVLVYKQVVIEKENKLIFKIFDLKKLPNFAFYLHHWLKDFGFTSWDDIYQLVDAQSGKKVYSAEFVLLKDRGILILERIRSGEDAEYQLDGNQNEISTPINLRIEEVTALGQPKENCIFVDADKISFPLKLRKWKQGDEFYPFGMSQRKKVSKFFKDEKVPLTEKNKIWLLESEDKIIWVVNYRADDRFKVTSDTRSILKISYIP